MHIVCPHCTTSYAIDLATLGGAGRSVRCSRCKEVWLARPEDAVEFAPTPVMAGAGDEGEGQDAAAEWDALAREGEADSEAPHMDSPSIAGGWQNSSGWPAEPNDEYGEESSTSA